MPIGRENVYVCQKCGGFTTTVDVDEGTTPFGIGCMASGDHETCDGIALSAFYPTGPRPAHIPPPSFEWYRPFGPDYDRLRPAHKQHVDLGGLILRRRVQ